MCEHVRLICHAVRNRNVFIVYLISIIVQLFVRMLVGLSLLSGGLLLLRSEVNEYRSHPLLHNMAVRRNTHTLHTHRDIDKNIDIYRVAYMHVFLLRSLFT